jgi:N12 class adenine-specific DNA methylase
MNPEIRLDTHQVNAVARHLYGGNALYGHVVGAGKTFSMIASAMESKRLGLCNKAMFVVPNNIIGDFAGDFFRLYPSANVLMATAKDFEKKNRKKFCARIATGEYDGIIIGHSQFEKLALSVERQTHMIEKQIHEIEDGIAVVKSQRGERFTIKQMEKSRKALEVKLTRLNDQSRKDDTVTFEELGIDRLFVDEADMFKNLYFITKMRNVAGITQTDAQKASDMFMRRSKIQG